MANEELIAQQQAAAEAEHTAATQPLLEGMPNATEPLDPTRLNTVAEMLDQALGALSDEEPLNLPEYTQPLDRLPDELALPVISTAAFFQSDQAPPEAQAYDFDNLEAMITTNDGLAQLAQLFGAMAQDQALAQALITQAAPPDGAPDGQDPTASGPPAAGPDPAAGGPGPI